MVTLERAIEIGDTVSNGPDADIELKTLKGLNRLLERAITRDIDLTIVAEHDELFIHDFELLQAALTEKDITFLAQCGFTIPEGETYFHTYL